MPQTLPNPQTQLCAVPRLPAAERRFDAPAPLRVWHLASLDAPTVAVVWTLGFAWSLEIRLPFWIPALLALTAWSVYVADRLLDARAALHDDAPFRLRERHLFHHRHRGWLIPAAIASACAAACIVLMLMPAPARERNSVLGAAALAYFTGVHSPHWLSSLRISRLGPLFRKELLVGLLFAGACALPAISRAPRALRGPFTAAAVFFAALAWLNCHAIDRWESDPSTGSSRIVLPASLLALAGLPAAALLSSAQPRLAALVMACAASALLLALLDRLRHSMTPLALRAAADLVLLTPLALLLK